jgi:RadC-like JAB domain
MWPYAMACGAGAPAAAHPATEPHRQQNSHNHPSGNPTPSPEDIACTAKLMAAGRILGITVLHHIIVTRDSRRWYSMHARGTLPADA